MTAHCHFCLVIPRTTHPSKERKRWFRAPSPAPPAGATAASSKARLTVLLGQRLQGDGVLGKPTRQLACAPRCLGNGLLCCQACDGGSGVPLGTVGASAAPWGQERDSTLGASVIGSRLVPSHLEAAASPAALGWCRTAQTASGHRCHLCCFGRGPQRTATWRGQSVCQAHPSPPLWQPRALWTEADGGPQKGQWSAW